MVNCPDCNILMSQHTLQYFHKKGGYCKGAFQEQVNEEAKEEVNKEIAKQPPKQKPTKIIATITGDIANTCINENPGIVTNSFKKRTSYESTA